MTTFNQGAEAIITKKGNTILKERIVKKYRIAVIDTVLRKQRTRREAKLLHKAEGIAPNVVVVDERTMTITMDYVEGGLLKDVLDHLSDTDKKKTLLQLGKHIATLHERDIIHGDLTTANIIVKDNKPTIIDFGLGSISAKIEAKAVDLYLLRQALESKHAHHADHSFDMILQGYSNYAGHAAVLKRLEKIASRGRYRGKQQNL